MTAVWEFDVGVSTHDRLRRGETVAAVRRVVVAEDTYDGAALLACQIAAADGVIPTELWWRF